jgi:hypothetical protein
VAFLFEVNMRKHTQREKYVVKQEVIAAMQRCARKLGRPPSFVELRRMTKVTINHIRNYFGTYTRALRLAGLEVGHAGTTSSMEDLFNDWVAVARAAKRIPTMTDQNVHGKYSPRPLLSRFGSWTRVVEGMRAYAEREGLDHKHPELMAMAAAWKPRGLSNHARVARDGDGVPLMPKPKLRPDRPVYGSPMWLPGLAHEPVNEAGVLYLFGMVAYKLGFVVTRVQSEFPDCEVLREIEPGRWQPQLVELEYESSRFLAHGHDPNKCDVIVCWKHNWPDCPAHIEVIELSSIIKRLV